jgi:hypothetical protein
MMNMHQIDEALHDASYDDKIAHLSALLIFRDPPGAQNACLRLIASAKVIARHLDPVLQLCIAKILVESGLELLTKERKCDKMH